MSSGADPFEVLGVGRDASLAEVRLAYRAAALKHHPDNCPGDPLEAQRKFAEISEAYRAVRRIVRRADAGAETRRNPRTFEPQDFTRMAVGWHTGRDPTARVDDPEPWRALPGTHKISLATLNEPRVFAMLWVLAIVLSVTGTYVAARLRVRVGFREEMHPAEALVFLVMPLAIYAVLTTTALLAVVLSRRIVWLIGQLGHLARRALPAPPDERELPPVRSGRHLPNRNKRK